MTRSITYTIDGAVTEVHTSFAVSGVEVAVSFLERTTDNAGAIQSQRSGTVGIDESGYPDLAAALSSFRGAAQGIAAGWQTQAYHGGSIKTLAYTFSAQVTGVKAVRSETTGMDVIVSIWEVMTYTSGALLPGGASQETRQGTALIDEMGYPALAAELAAFRDAATKIASGWKAKTYGN